MKKNNRWYDRHRVGKYLDLFRDMTKDERDPIILGIMQLVKEYGSAFIDESVMDFPLELLRRRWYDKDPYLWIIFNGLQRAEPELLDKIADYLAKTMT
jgi:hypothetical protein